MEIGKKNSKKLVTGVGSALIDILTYEDDEFVKRVGAIKGGMILVDSETIGNALLGSQTKSAIVPGGSACNTMIGIARLGGASRFVGKLGKDKFASLFREGLEKSHVDAMVFTSDSPTGRVLSIITSDAQRSMMTFLGASAEIMPDEISEQCFAHSAIVHVEGYLIFNKDLITTVLKTAKQAGAYVSLDMASHNVVSENKDAFEHLVHEYVDILIANEDEAKAFTGFDDELKAIASLAEKAEIAVLKVGDKGSYIATQNKVIKIEPQSDGAVVVDTTGAGDLWAAGFLFGLVNGYPLETCGTIGSACGYEVCQVVGAEIPLDGWNRIRKQLEKLSK